MLCRGRLILFNVVVLLVITSVSARLSFVTEPADQVVAEGQSVMLNCQATDSNGRSFGINWKRNNDWLLVPSNKPWQLLRNNSLYYQSITANDVGEFLCAATISGTSENIYSRKAKVQLAYTDAQFSSSPTNHTKRVGDLSTYFTCITGDSLPSSSVYWEKDGQKITTGTVTNVLIDSGKPGIKWTSSSLSIKNIDFSSAGFYRCVAVNPLAPSKLRKSKAAYLHVLPRIDKPHFQVHPSNLIAAEGRPAILQCLVLGVPKPQVSWTFNGHSLLYSATRQTLSNGSLYFAAVNKSFAGQYKCKGSNSAGFVESSPVLFSVAFFEFHFFKQPESQNVTMGSKVTLNCRPPNSYPVNVKINWFKNFQEIKAGPGITITSQGSLVFSAIKKSDEGEYFCNGVNPVLLESRTSNVAYITVWVPPTFMVHPQDTAVIQYQPLLLHCKSTGFPTPSLTWLKDGRSLNTSHVDVLANGSLSIPHTTVKDTGLYFCEASNVAGKAVVNAKVVIYVSPAITVYPSDAVCVLGQPITFKCNFTGMPLPHVQWFHNNGTTILPVPSTPKYTRSGYTLTVTSVSIQDEGTFICKGINVAGTMNASAYLNVQVPVSLDAGPVNITVNQSSPASFQCIASGDPKPNITWYKEGKLLQGTGHFIITGDTLSIPATNTKDAGEYQCHVTNGLATHVGTAQLVVQVIPVIISFTVPTFARLGGNTTVFCQSTGIPRPQVTWYRNGNVIVAGLRVFLSHDGSLSIVGISAGEGGIYTCAASNAAGTTSRKGNLTIQVPPSPPTTLLATPLSSTSIKLSWQPGFNGHTPITGYKIDIKREGQLLYSELKASINRLMLVANGLVPYTRYTFRVLARNLIGLSQGTEISQTTLEDAPSEPTSILLTTLNATAIQVSWSTPSRPNGVITWYEIAYQSLPNGSVLKNESLVKNGSSRSLVLFGLQPFTEYAVRVRAATGQISKKWGNYSTDVVIRTAQAAPEEPPRDVQYKAWNSTAVFISWKPVSINSANGIVKEYHISYQAIGEYHNSSVTMVTVGEEWRNLTIVGLYPWTYYKISVQAVTVSAGPGSAWKTVRTHEAAPSGPPIVNATSFNESSILVTMAPPPPPVRNGQITGYKVYYKKSNSFDPFSPGLFTSSNEMTVLIGNLSVFTKYDIIAAAVTRAGTGTKSDKITVETDEGVPGAVTHISVVKKSHDAIEITWSEPQPRTGNILDYTVNYNTTIGPTMSNTTTDSSITLTKLTHNATYHIWVIARTKKGVGPIGMLLAVRTDLPPTTGSPTVITTPLINGSEPTVIKSSEQRNDVFFSLSKRDFIIIVVCANLLLLILIVIAVYCACTRPRNNRAGFSETTKSRKIGGLDLHELRGVSPDRRPVLDVQEETSVNDSFDEFSEWNSSVTGVASEPVMDPAPLKSSAPIRPIIEYPEESETKSVDLPAITNPGLTQSQSQDLASPVMPSYESFKNSPIARIRNSNISLGSNDSFYDQPYSSVDELGTGFSSFTPPPPPDFRNDEPHSDTDSSPAEPPQEFSNKLYIVRDETKPEHQPTLRSGYSDPGYAEPEIKRKNEPEPERKGESEPKASSPPPPYFSSDYAGIENEGYDTDEELDKYLAEQEEKTKKIKEQKQPSSSRSPTSSRSQSVSPPSLGSAGSDKPEVVYAKVDKSKKKKKSKSPSEESRKSPYDAVVVYDERTNL